MGKDSIVNDVVKLRVIHEKTFGCAAQYKAENYAYEPLHKADHGQRKALAGTQHCRKDDNAQCDDIYDKS